MAARRYGMLTKAVECMKLRPCQMPVLHNGGRQRDGCRSRLTCGEIAVGAMVHRLSGSIYSMRAMVNFLRNAFNVVVSIFLVTFIAINLVQLGKFLLSSQGLI